MNSILVQIGPISIKWYSFFILIGVIIAYFIITTQAHKKGIKKESISDMFFYLVIFSILGARLYYCIFNLNYYLYHPLDIIKIWEGGLAIHGGIIAGLIVIFIYCKKNSINLLDITDIFSVALVLGQAIGRWGNFFNQEAYGPITSYNTLKRLGIPDFIINGMYIDYNYHHPTFLYESFGCIIILIIILILNKILKKRGINTSLYLILYGIIRFFIEGLRTDSLMLFNIKVAQLVSLISIIIGLIVLVRSLNDK